MLKKLATALTALTLALGFSAAAVTSAQATDLPATPLVVLEKANCTTKANTLKFVGPEGIDTANYRFVLYKGDSALKQLNTAERNKLYAGTLTAESLGGSSVEYPGDYSLQPYYRDKDNKYKSNQTTVKLVLGEALTKAVKLGEKEKFELVDPKSLDCTKPAEPTPTPTPTEPANPGTGTGDTGSGSTGGTGTPAAPTYEPAPAAPSFELTAAACVNNKAVNNLLTVDPAEKKDNYRFVATLNGQSISLKEELRNKLWADGKISAEDIATAYPGFKVPYGETITVQPYWFDKEKVNDPATYDKVLKLTQGKSDRFIKLGEPKSFVPVDPTTLNCNPPAPTPTYEPAPAAPSFELTAAACVNNKAVNNLLTVDPAEKKDNYRFVATLNGQSISLKEELRNKLWADGKISAEDIATAYPGFKVPYGETITVQPYWFDAEKVNDPASYDTVLKLAAGKSDRFIKLGEAKTVTLVDPTGLKCETQPGTGQPGPDQPGTNQPGPAVPVPQQPAAPTTPAPQPSGKSGNLAKTGAADSTLAIGTAAALLGLGAATIAVRRRKAS